MILFLTVNEAGGGRTELGESIGKPHSPPPHSLKIIHETNLTSCDVALLVDFPCLALCSSTGWTQVCRNGAMKGPDSLNQEIQGENLWQGSGKCWQTSCLYLIVSKFSLEMARHTSSL